MKIALRLATGLPSPAGPRARLLAFFFHRVLAQPDPLQPGEVDARRFDRYLTWIGEQFNVLRADEACERLAAGTLPARAAIITFDDGYRDNHDVARTLLTRHRMSAAFFIATSYLGEGVQFNDRLTEAFRDIQSDTFDADWLGLGTLPVADAAARFRALDRVRETIKYFEPAQRWAMVERVESQCGSRGAGLQRGRVMMTPQEVRALRDHGMVIGGHTLSHPILQRVDDATARREIADGREAVRAIVGEAPSLFSYPNGKRDTDFSSRHVEMVRDAGYSFAFSTHRGFATRDMDPLNLPRFMPWNDASLKFKLQALRTLTLA